MKKLMFALIAGVAVSAAQAVDVFADGDGFENKAVDTPATNVNTKFAYIASDTSGDGSAVKAYGQGEAYAGARNAAFVGDNNNYLELNTDGGTLYRSILEPAGVNQIGPATNLTSSFFIDTLVKFTACDSAQEIDSSAKLAIWLQVSGDHDENTNLVVRANKMKLTFEDETLESGVATDELYTISGTYNADQWYRLTVEDLGNVFNSDEGLGATGFKISINGSPVSAANGNVAVTLNDGSSAADLLDGVAANSSFATGLTDGSIFLSLQDDTIANVDYSSSLQAVGFYGTGCVDDILFTSLDPFWVAPSTLDFTLTLGENVTSVSYTIGEGEPVVVNATSTFKVAPGAQISLNITTASSTWRTYEASVAAGDNATVSPNGTTVTVRTIEQTDDNQLTAGATVSATDTATALVDGDVTAEFLGGKGITNAGLLAGLAGNAAGYRSFLTWAENNRYDLARVNGAVNAYTRFSHNWPIEMEVYVGGDAGVTSYNASTNNGSAFTDQTASVSGTKYTIDAGDSLSLDNFMFDSAGENQEYLLDGAAANWTYGASAATGLASLTVGSDSNSVVFVTDPAVQAAKVGLKTVVVSTAPPTYDFTVTYGSNVSAVHYVIGVETNTVASGDKVTVAENTVVTFLPASSLTNPIFYWLEGGSTETNKVLSWTADADTAGTFYAYALSEASDADAKDFVEEAAKEAGASADVAAQAAAKATAAAATSAAISASAVAAWVKSNVSGAGAYAALADADADDVAAAVGLGLGELVADPKVEITEVGDDTVNDGADAAYALTFKVTNQAGTQKDVGSAVADYVKGLVKMTSNLSDWDGSSKITDFDVEVSVNGDGTATAKVEKPAATTAFMKIGE